MLARRMWNLPHAAFQLGALAVAVALFAVRRHRPEAVLLALAALAGAAPVTGPVTAGAAYTVMLDTVRPRHRVRLLGGAIALVMASGAATGRALGPGSAVYGLELGLVLAVTAVVVPGLIGTVCGQQPRLLRALRERADAAERARRIADTEARTHERSRIAAEMHDLVGHRLSLISLHAGGLELALGEAAPELREEAVLVRRATRDAMRELRQALGVLGPLARDTGPDAFTDATGTRSDVETLVAGSRDGGIAVQLEWSGPDLDGCPAPVRRAVHRVVREALTNVHRYAAAAPVTVRVARDDRTVRVTVRNGPPPAPVGPPSGAGTGRGLTGLRERVELLGGAFEADALPSGGFRVAAAVPVEPDDGAAWKRSDDGTEPPPAATGDATALPRAPRTAGALTLALGAAALWVLMTLAIAMVYAQPRHLRPVESRPGATACQEAPKGGVDGPAPRAAATGHVPPRPAAAVRRHRPEDPDPRAGSGGPVRYRVDASARLLADHRSTVPSVRDTTPRETP